MGCRQAAGRGYGLNDKLRFASTHRPRFCYYRCMKGHRQSWPLAVRVLFAVVVAGFCSGCLSPVKVKRADPQEIERRELQSVLLSNRLSQETQQYLRVFHLEHLWEKDPEAVFQIVDIRALERNDDRALYAAAELALLQGRKTIGQDKEAAMGWFLVSAERAQRYLVERPRDCLERVFDQRHFRFQGFYDRAVAHFVNLLQETGTGRVRNFETTILGETYRVSVISGPAQWEADYFDRLIPSAKTVVLGLRNHYRQHGLGAALSGVRENQGAVPVEAYYPPEGMIFPVSAVLHFDPLGEGQAQLEKRAHLALYNPLLTPVATCCELRVPLEADFTTPYALLLARTDFQFYRAQGLLDIEHASERMGVYMLQPYDPDKIPLLMVHGLLSSPLAWMEASNDITGDPKLREHYQVWHYVYPSGYPFLYSAMLLRRSLEALRATVDPGGEHDASHSMVIVAHSMGGLLAKTMVSDSGSALWDATYTVAPHALHGAREEIETYRRIFWFRPKPYVKRVVFIATPHRGSRLASSPIGALGSGLTNLPDLFEELIARVAKANEAFLTDSMREVMINGGPTSIRALSPEHPLMPILAALPIHPRVAYHTIIGDRGRHDGPDSSDGVVPYGSSHLDGARSELVVPAGHKLYRHPMTILEIKRILRLHLRENGRLPEWPATARSAL